MDIIDELRAFVATAQSGSFTAAADRIGVSNRLTSKYVAELEQRLGVRLFQRTTRRVGLTPAGEDLLARAPGLLDDLDELLTDMTDGSKALTGMIRVAAPLTFGETYVAGMLGRFMDENPDITIDLRLDDRFSDLATQGIDLGFRIGQTDTLSIKARKLGELQSILVASPDYLDQHGAPTSAADLSNHACIVDTNRRNPREWAVIENGQNLMIPVQGRFLVNSARAAADLAADGKGIAFSPRFALFDGLSSGRLVPVLDTCRGDPIPVSAVYLEGRRLPRKIRALIEFAAKDIKTANVL